MDEHDAEHQSNHQGGFFGDSIKKQRQFHPHVSVSVRSPFLLTSINTALPHHNTRKSSTYVQPGQEYGVPLTARSYPDSFS